MRITPTSIAGAVILDLETRADDRGFFARIFCAEEFATAGLNTRIAQSNMSRSLRRGTMRGLHRQIEPDGESKLVRCPRGAIFDVCVDMREESPTYLQWVGVRLDEENGRMLYVPERCAHGFLTLEDDTVAVYDASVPYAPASVRGVRFDDPAIGIDWPIDVTVISEQDRRWPLLTPSGAN